MCQHPVVRAEHVADGLAFAEGPVWCPDGTLVVTSVAEGALYRVDPVAGTAVRFADTGGGANGAALAADGSVLVTQNGGFDFAATGLFASPPPLRPTEPGLQLASPSGEVRYLARDGFRAPNDVAVAADGRVLFTDPPHFPPPEEGVGRVMVLERDGSVGVFAEGFWYCNGLAFEPDGTLVVVERAGLQRVHPGGGREWVVETLGRGAGDGLCVDADGRFYVASTVEHGIRVVDRDGTVLDFLRIDGDGLTTNCCFGGPDLRTLFVTDALPGRLVAFEGMPVPGLPLPPWPGFAPGRPDAAG
ncbi:MAG: gluconolactonase [Acidimicrobiia bacterium]|nr:MAG: gluconolactonase [Acidimicrobiia bacterium]